MDGFNHEGTFRRYPTFPPRKKNLKLGMGDLKPSVFWTCLNSSKGLKIGILALRRFGGDTILRIYRLKSILANLIFLNTFQFWQNFQILDFGQNLIRTKN